ncbi:GNAT family N-acetyltransferase [Tengunoibacter tsumagoiensis]|uniref:GNAT family acetyltransferase n=1 Tax=Tengunoibacter tsumagoiensis TaxID=2014871 RepID=A0A401ZZY9_9CHLR|nr:GNAT family N-acetyltransferase [Tengunoibacter tsumagoiensis]GCE12413.1 GNAT family acetyltransferase [Tengunoibacter tsumagoiensis]
MTLQFPEGFFVRSATLDDVRSVTDFMRFCQQSEYGFALVSEADTLTLWTSPEVDLTHDTWLVFSLHDQIVAYLHLGHKNPLRLSVVLKVHPDSAHLGLQASLLKCVEERARQFIPQVRADARISLSISCSDPTTIYRQAIERAGFIYVRSNLRMEIEMNEPPPPVIWPEGITLRPFTLEMARAVHAADDEGFQDHWGYMPVPFETFQHEYITASKFDPTLWFLAFEDEKIVGCALCECREDRAWVNSLSVVRPWRQRGLGLALLHTAFGELYHRGERKVALEVDAQSLTGATRLYERAGMHKVRQFDRYEKELRAGRELSTQELEV